MRIDSSRPGETNGIDVPNTNSDGRFGDSTTSARVRYVAALH